MSLLKKFMPLAAAATALAALAVPSAAGAQMLRENGKQLFAGATVTAVSTNTEITTTSGTLSCEGLVFRTTITANNSIFSRLFGEGEAEGCEITQNGAPVAITSLVAEEIYTEGEEEGIASLSFVADIAGVLTCVFSGTAPTTYEAETDKLRIQGGLAVSGAGCPTSGEFHGDFKLRTPEGQEVTID